MKNLRYNNILLRALTILCLMMASVGAWAADYVLAYVNGGTTYYLARNGTTGVARTNTFNPTTCIWSCENADGTASTLNNSNTYGYLYQTVNGTKYYLYADVAAFSLKPDRATNNYSRMRTNGTYVYNRYSGTYSYYINLANNAPARNTTANTASNARPYAVTTGGGSDFSVSISHPTSDSYIGNVGGTMTISAQVSGNYAPAYYNFNNKYYYTTNGTTYTEANSAPQVYQFNYNYEIISGGSNASITGNTVTYTKDAGEDVEVTVRVTATPQGYASVTRTDECTFTLRSATLAAPTITRITGTNKYEITYPAGATARYSTDGTDINEYASNGTEYSDIITVTTPGAIIKARAVRDGVVSAQTEYIVSDVILDAPVISITDDGTVTITNPNDFASDATIYYTTNGSEPTTSSSAYGASFKVSNGATIKAIISKAGYTNSEVAEKRYSIESGVSGGVVTLNDYEDHTWTYYAGVDSEVDGGNYNTNYKGKLYSPNPRNVKITYKANGGAVSIDESETEFVYYKTLEESATAGEYQYQVISNPFSKRPNGKGFGGWQITKGADYIKNKNANATLALDEEIVFENLPYPSVNCTSAEIELTATWVNANIQYGGGNINATAFRNGNYETNLLVINANYTNALTPTYPVTIMMVEPDGSADYRGRTLSSSITPVAGAANTTKIEFANWTNTGNINAQGRNLTIGRGVTHSGGTLYGTNTDANINQVFKIESGSYTTFYAIGANGPTNNMTKQHITFGNDYDRANNNDNSKMTITNGMYLLGRGANTGTDKLIITAKSGSFTPSLTHTTAGASGNCFYLSYNSGTTVTNHRTLIIEGGEFWHIAGGYDNYTSTDVNLKLRVKGGIIHGCIYGGAAQYPAGGSKQFVFTGGTVEGWIAGGANGYLSAQAGRGQTNGYSYVYVGGNAVVDSGDNNTGVDNALGGNVYGAGCGNADLASAGRIVNGSNVVLADNAFVERGVYGGGAYGDSQATANVYVTGGHVASGYDTKYNVFGGVYGGARQKGGGSVNIYMTGGQIDGNTHNAENGGGLFGGSNYSGTIANNVTMRIDGGQVGTESKAANIHGGGYGQNTQVTQNVDITLGKTGAARDADGVTVWGDVYGGSALGKVNGEAATDTYHTNVTMNAGYIHGSLYGGALGDAGTAANVYGPVQVKVYGGSVFNTDGTGANGSGAVYGANNVKGAPQMSATVDIYGTNSAPAEGKYALFSVYGGGNAADYTYGNGYPKVTVHNCDNSIEYVYGGGNAAAVQSTDVTIYGGDKIGNVFGGGNGQVRAANVNGNTNVKIYGGTIGDVYGGSNTNGNITGTINVNVNAQAEPDHSACPIDIDNVYGGGNKAASNVGKITIGCAEHIGAVYGGANQANVTGDITLNINAGHIDNVFGGNNNSGAISGNIIVNVDDKGETCGMSVGNVYGGGNKAAYGHGTNYPVVNIINADITGSVFGGGLGASAVVTGNPQVNIADWDANHAVTIGGNVFGGGDAAAVNGTPVVVVNDCNTAIGSFDGSAWTGGDIFGGGNAAAVTGTNLTVWGGTMHRVFAGGNGTSAPANVGDGGTNAHIFGGTIGEVYGGSNSQGTITGTINVEVNEKKSTATGAALCQVNIDDLYGGGNMAASSAGNISISKCQHIGRVFGGANQANVSGDITLNITDGHIDNVFGGNNNSGQVSGNITVNVNWANGVNADNAKVGNVYGGGNIASIDNGTPRTVTVNIPNATISGSVFGGGKGKEAVIVGSTNVNLGTWPASTTTTVNGDVFGGGDLAAVEGDCKIVIRDCNTLITGDLYGGGNAAPVYSTNTTMWGGTVAGNIFGGGNGKDATKNPNGAQVGYKRNDTTDGGAGTATTRILGGTVGTWAGDVCTDGTGGVFGGSNTNGNIRGGIDLTVDQQQCSETGATQCDLKIRELYGAGNEAAYAGGDINFNLGCVDYLEEVYGGAKAADLQANAVLNITSGHFRKVFGGNNISGRLYGSITVNVDETGCNPVVIDELYGGGNLAAYSIYGYNADGTPLTSGASPKANPQVNVISCTRIGTVYGGGYGLSAVMVGSPTVNINQIRGEHSAAIGDELGVIGNVFGGGNAAKVIGDTTVNVGNLAQNAHLAGPDTDPTAAGANITGNIYGGGNMADVTGKTNVNIGR